MSTSLHVNSLVTAETPLLNSEINTSVDDKAPIYRKESDGDRESRDVAIIIDRSSILHSTTNCETFMHLLRANLGTGLLAMPAALLSAGIWVGFAGIFLIGTCCIYCMHLLINNCHRMCKSSGHISLGYGQVMEEAMATAPSLRRLATYGSTAINTFLMITQLGFCCIYIVFIADNIKYVIHHFHANDPDVRIYMAAVICLLIPYILIKHLTILSIFSFVANLLIVVSLIIITQYIVQDLPDVSVRPAFNSTATLPLFIGTVFYTFEGIGCLLPIENQMIYPDELGGYSGVLNLALVISTVMYAGLGFFGYLKFGDSVKGSITLSLPKTSWLYLSVNIMIAAVVFITFAIQYYVPISVMWPWFKQRFKIERHQTIVEIVFRISLLLFTAIFALVVPHLELLIALVGAMASTALAIIFPAIIDLLVRKSEHRLTILTITVDTFLVIVGLVSCVIGTYTTIKEIIETF